MAVTPPPIVAPLTGTPPNKGQSEEDFNTNQQNFVNYQVGFAPDINALADWTEDVSNQVEGWANSAQADALATSNDRVAAQAAAAAAQAAAGLTPDPDFGMVIATTAAIDVKTTDYTAEIGKIQDVDTSGGGPLSIAPPESPNPGAWFGVRDINQDSFGNNYPILVYNGDNIIGQEDDHFIDINTAIYTYRGPVKGWCL